MKQFDVYKRFPIDLVKGQGVFVFDSEDKRYLDLYGGHAVISIGHKHPHYVNRIEHQLEALGYYSNSVKLPIQEELASVLGAQSGMDSYNLFLCNSGAEAVENALKVASFHTGRKIIITFDHGFHGRTAGAVAATDNPSIQAPVNNTDHIRRLPYNDSNALQLAFEEYGREIAAVLIEPIQGVGGIRTATDDFLLTIDRLCQQHGAIFIADEIQSGFGRTGKFFCFQHSRAKPQIVTMAKGMGNGFPVAGILIHPEIEAKPGMLGTTFGGNPLACAASLAVLEVLESEHLMERAERIGTFFRKKLSKLPHVLEVRGKGLMIGVVLDFPIADLRKTLVLDHGILTGNAKQQDILRFLPPLTIKKKQIKRAIKALTYELEKRPKISES